MCKTLKQLFHSRFLLKGWNRNLYRHVYIWSTYDSTLYPRNANGKVVLRCLRCILRVWSLWWRHYQCFAENRTQCLRVVLEMCKFSRKIDFTTLHCGLFSEVNTRHRLACHSLYTDHFGLSTQLTNRLTSLTKRVKKSKSSSSHRVGFIILTNSMSRFSLYIIVII